jgi:hypothetical protein
MVPRLREAYSDIPNGLFTLPKVIAPHDATKKGKAVEAGFGPEGLQFAEQTPVGTEPIAISTSNNSDYALTRSSSSRRS